MFKAAVRRVKGDFAAKLRGDRFECIVHEASPGVAFHAPDAEIPAYWAALVAEVNGAALWHHEASQCDTEAEAMLRAGQQMRRGGWRDHHGIRHRRD